MCDGKVGDTRLGNDTAIVVINLKDTVEFAKPKQDGVGKRQCPTGQ